MNQDERRKGAFKGSLFLLPKRMVVYVSHDELEARIRQVEKDIVELRVNTENTKSDIREIKEILMEQKRAAAQNKIALFTTAGSAIIMLLSTILIFVKG